MVPPFAASQDNISIPPLLLSRFRLCHLDLFRQSVGLLMGFQQHIENQAGKGNGSNETHDLDATGKNQANLVNDEADCISKQALIPDGKPSPLGIVHLPLDGAHSRKAGSAEQVEGQEGIATDGGEGAGQVAVNRTRAAVENAHGTHDVFFCHQACDGSHPFSC